MKLFDGTSWRSAPDAHRSEGAIRLRPTRWLALEELDDLHIVPGRSIRRLFDYAREIGPIRTARKVVSRLGERDRNQKICACGIGEVVESDEESEVGTFRLFFAPVAPPAVERIVVDRRLTRPARATEGPLELLEASPTRAEGQVSFWRDLAGWMPESGRELPATDDLLDRCEALLSTAVANRVETFDASPIAERREAEVEGERLVTVFGWGHHARTQIVPAIPDNWGLGCVHEIDPALETEPSACRDTSPMLRPDEPADVVSIAGFHSSHSSIAAEALRRGATVVVEKPVVTTREQLDDLADAWSEPSRCFALYHKRYGELAGFLKHDLEGPIDMHASVFEIPLPRRHWYRWPSSGGRLVSNGCHWIDQFLWLNDWAEVVDAHAHRGPRGQVVASLSLESGAFLSLTLTDRGSARLGTREVVEYRSNDRTARIIDARDYLCEDDERTIRRASAHPLEALERAYETVFDAIAAGRPGDSWRSIEGTHRAVLELADQAKET